MSGQIQVTMITDRVKGDLSRYTERAAKKVMEARKITAINVQRVAKESAPVNKIYTSVEIESLNFWGHWSRTNAGIRPR